MKGRRRGRGSLLLVGSGFENVSCEISISLSGDAEEYDFGDR